jgi:hypothetical protein
MTELLTTEPQAIDYPLPGQSAVVKVTDKADVADAIGVRFNGGGTASSTFWAINDRVGRGVNIFNIGWPGVEINRMSQIAVSICELGPDGAPFIGSAHMQILNVAPQNDSTVFVRYNVAWSGNPLTYRFNFIIVN